MKSDNKMNAVISGRCKVFIIHLFLLIRADMAPNIIDIIIPAVFLKLTAAQIPVQHYSNTRWAPQQYHESYSNIQYQEQLPPPPRYSDPAYIYHYPEPYPNPVSSYQSSPNSSPYTTSYTSSYAQPSVTPPVSTLTKPSLPTSPPLTSSAISSQTPIYSQMAPPYSTITQTTSYTSPSTPNLSQPAPSTSASSVTTASKTSNSPVSSTDSSKSLPISNSPLKSLQTLSTNKTAVKAGSNDVDSTVLNNLAIALQLLIVNNILKSPASGEGESALSALNLETESSVPLAPPPSLFSHPPSTPAPNTQTQSFNQMQPYQNQNTFESSVTGLNGYPTPAMTNANFLGSSNLLSPGSSMMGSPYTPQHKSMSNFRLMSPYEALTSSSSSEMLSSPFGSSSDFQSPYAALLSSDNNRDLFSMNGFL